MKARADLSRALALRLGNAAVLAVLLGLVWAGGELYFRFCVDGTDSFGSTKLSRRWLQRHHHDDRMKTRDDVDCTMRKILAHELATDAIGTFLEQRVAPRATRARPVEVPDMTDRTGRGTLGAP